MTKTRVIGSVAAVLLASIGCARAGVLYDNLAVGTNDNFLMTTPDMQAGAQFRTDATGTIAMVQLLLAGDVTNTGGSIEVSLFDDIGNYPANQVGSPLGDIRDSAMDAGGNFTVHALHPSITGLAPNSPYWLVMFDTSTDPALSGPYGGTSIIWSTAGDDSGSGVAGGYYYTQSDQFLNSDQFFGPAQMSISSCDTATCAAVKLPEPGSFAILGLGVLGLAAWRWRA